jgi:hypothetical protein
MVSAGCFIDARDSWNVCVDVGGSPFIPNDIALGSFGLAEMLVWLV